jgi:murein L,D-transpeptidase YcbB/YkuD
MQTFLTRLIIQGVFVATMLIVGCRPAINRSGAASTSKDFQVEELPPILLIPADSNDQLYDGLKRKKSVIKFYELRNNKPAWSDSKNILLLGDSMISMIKNVRYYGLLPKDYHLFEIEDNKQTDTGKSLLRTDVLLTDAFLSIAKDLKYGRLSNTAKVWDDSLQISLLQQTVSGQWLKTNLELQEPMYPGYCALKEALKLSLDSLMDEDRIAFMEGRSDDSHPLTNKLRLIEINIERWRLENTISGDRYIFINIPSFWLEIVSNDTIVLESKVIVGTADRPTPLLSSEVECFIIYPYWHVPRKIAVEEYLPILKKDTSFLKGNNFDVLDSKGNVLDSDSIDWGEFNKNYFPVLLRQREGPENSLGVIKFVFDNPYAVFLHDTNAKRLFRKDVRAFSHGCIRMEKAFELAHYLATGEINKRSKTIEIYLKQRQRHTVDLPNPIPIYVRYFTCEFKDGVFLQYKDIYKRDQKIARLFYE